MEKPWEEKKKFARNEDNDIGQVQVQNMVAHIRRLKGYEGAEKEEEH